MTTLLTQDVVPPSQYYLFTSSSNTSRRSIVIAGTVYGKYTVIDGERYIQRGKWRYRACLVRCVCGVERVVANMNLRSGNSGSCGCNRYDRKPDSNWQVLLAQLRNRARRGGRLCNLNLEQLKFISQMDCAYCGAAPCNRFHRLITVYVEGKAKRVNDDSNPMFYSGIDRVDSCGDYVAGNILPCCFFCNRAKDDWPLSEFLERLTRFGSTLQVAPLIAFAENLAARLEKLK